MFTNYFILQRIALELQERIAGAEILEAFSQEKDKLLIAVEKDFDETHLEISVNPGFPYFQQRKGIRKAKKNTAELFPLLNGSTLRSMQFAEGDRVLKVITDRGSIFFTVRGKYTNVFYKAPGGAVETFKKMPNDELARVMAELEEIRYSETPYLPPFSSEDAELSPPELRKKYPFTGKEIINEASLRSDGEDFITAVTDCIEAVLYENIKVIFNKDSGEAAVLPYSFRPSLEGREEVFTSALNALSTFVSRSYRLQRSGDRKKIIEKHLSRELKKAASKLNDLKARLDKGSRDDEYEKYGNLLLINLGKIPAGARSFTTDDIYTGAEVTIPLKNDLSPQQNADNYFDKAKSERTNIEKSRQLFAQTEKNYAALKDIEQRFENAGEHDELETIMDELNIKDGGGGNEKSDPGQKFKRYLIEGKYMVYVGKDSRNNDLLTMKFAKQNDYWFHARSVSGSHVIIRVDNPKDGIPKNVLKKAAALAAYHSKAKTAGVVPVAYTFKKHVVKKKGMPAGQVRLLKEDVLLVRPEIPPQTEFLSNE